MKAVANQKNTHTLWLDGLRGIGAVQVCLHHLLEQFPSVSLGVFSILSDGPLAVFIFFCIRGYVLAGWSNKPNIPVPKLIFARCIRLFIPAAIAVLLAFLLGTMLCFFYPNAIKILPIWGGYIPSEKYNLIFSVFKNSISDIFLYVPILGHRDGSFFINFPYIGNYVHNHIFTLPVLWTISTEFYGSVLIVLVTYLKIKLPNAAHEYLLLLIGFLTLRSLLFPFVLGYVLSHWKEFELFRNLKYLSLFLILTSFVITTDASNGRFYELFEHIARVSYSIPAQSTYSVQKAFAAIVIFFAILISPTARSYLSSTPCLFLGKISFPLYLTHSPLIMVFAFIRELISNYGFNNLLAIVIAFIIYICSVGISCWIFLFIDRWSINLSRTYLQPKQVKTVL